MDKFFKISERGSNVKTELIAGLTTFFAMADIVITNPNQITSFSTEGPLGQIWNAVYVASILVAVIGTLLMALYAKMPFAQACGMGLNSFFCTCFVSGAYFAGVDLIGGYHSGMVLVFLSGIVFLILSITGAREYIAKAMPECLKKSIPAGIGLFIAFIGFKNAGLITANQYTFVQFVDINGAFANVGTDGFTAFDAWCQFAPAVVAFLGFVLIAVLTKLNVKGSVLISILVTSVIYYLATWTMPNFDMQNVGQTFKDFGEIYEKEGKIGLINTLAGSKQFTDFELLV